jgi:hypothetical protein
MMSRYHQFLILMFWCISPIAFAGPPVLSEANRLFEFAENAGPTLFFPPAETLQASGEGSDWFYRYFSGSDTYIAISITGSGPFFEGNVYVLGGQFGANLLLVDSLDNLLAVIDAAAPPVAGGENAITNPGTGTCTERKFVAQNDFARFKTTTYSGNVTSISERSEFYEEVSATKTLTVIEQSTSVDGVQTLTSNRLSSYYESISGLLFEYENNAAITLTPDGSSSTSQSLITTYSPSLFVGPADSLCVGQQWYAAPVTRTTIDDSGAGAITNETPATVGTVNSIGEVVSVTGGTFSTVKMTLSYPESRTIIWFDLNFGVKVMSETYLGNSENPSVVEELTQFDLPF